MSVLARVRDSMINRQQTTAPTACKRSSRRYMWLVQNTKNRQTSLVEPPVNRLVLCILSKVNTSTLRHEIQYHVFLNQATIAHVAVTCVLANWSLTLGVCHVSLQRPLACRSSLPMELYVEPESRSRLENNERPI